MAIIDIVTKQTGDLVTADEFNSLVTAVKNLQGEKGHAVYFDTEYTAENPQVFTGTEFLPVSNNKGNFVETYLPANVTTLYDGTKILPPSTGAGFTAYVSFTAKASATNSYFELGVDIDGTFNEIFQNAQTVIRGSNTYQNYYIPINGYMLDTFNTNGGVLKLKPKTNNTISVYNTTIYVNVGYQAQ